MAVVYLVLKIIWRLIVALGVVAFVIARYFLRLVSNMAKIFTS